MSKENSYLRFLTKAKSFIDSELQTELKNEQRKEKILTPKERSDLFKKQLIEHFQKEDLMIKEFSINTEPVETTQFGDMYKSYKPANNTKITIYTSKLC